MKKLFQPSLGLVVLVAALPASAGWSFIPKVGIEHKSYSLEIGPGYPSADKEVTGTATGFSIGFTIANDNGWYFDFETFDGSGTHEGLVEAGENKAVRGEIAVSLGKAVGEGFTAFGGVRAGGNSYFYDDTGFQSGDESRLEVGTFGPFIGLSKSLILSSDTSLALSAAVASLTAEVKDFDVNSTGIDATGDALGYSLSMSLNKQLYEKWSMSLGGRYQAFTYKNVKDSNQIIGDQTEKVAAVFVKTSYLF